LRRCGARARSASRPRETAWTSGRAERAYGTDAEVALTLAKLADRTLEVAVGGYEGPETWEYPARRLTYFACEADVHQGLTRAFVVHPRPPAQRAKSAPRKERSARAKAGWGIGVREFIAPVIC
jgi:hypothetical protein